MSNTIKNTETNVEKTKKYKETNKKKQKKKQETNKGTNMEKICEVTSWVTSTTEYDKYPEQKSKPISLVAGEVYYFEVRCF